MVQYLLSKEKGFFSNLWYFFPSLNRANYADFMTVKNEARLFNTPAFKFKSDEF